MTLVQRLLTSLQEGDESKFVATMKSESIKIEFFLEMRDPTTWATLLHVAADHGLQEAIESIILGGKLNNSASFDSLLRAQTREGNVALHFAVRRSGACADVLLDAWPESINFLCANRESPLLYACHAACRSAVALLSSAKFRDRVNWHHVAKSGRNCLVALVCVSVNEKLSASALECMALLFAELDAVTLRRLLLWVERSRSHSILHSVVNPLAVGALPLILDAATQLNIAKELLAKVDASGATALEVVRAVRSQLQQLLAVASATSKNDVQRRFNDALAINLALERKQREIDAAPPPAVVVAPIVDEKKPKPKETIVSVTKEVTPDDVQTPKAPKAPKQPKQPKQQKTPKQPKPEKSEKSEKPPKVLQIIEPKKKKQPPAKPKPLMRPTAIEPGDGWFVVGKKTSQSTKVESSVESSAAVSDTSASSIAATVTLPPIVASSQPTPPPPAATVDEHLVANVDSLFDQCVELVNARSAVAASLDVRPHHVLGDLAELSMAQIECVEAILESLRHDANQAKMAIVHRLLSLQRRQ
jgi:hypothetical protein